MSGTNGLSEQSELPAFERYPALRTPNGSLRPASLPYPQPVVLCRLDELVILKHFHVHIPAKRGGIAEGFGAGIDFRMYERGAYGTDTAPYLVLSMQEGKPLGINELADALQQCHSQKKELTLAVMNRRGEIVYYSISQLTFK